MDTPHANEMERTQRYEALCELGDCYTSVGDYGRARRCYEQAACVGPDEPGPYLGLGVASLQRGNLDDAEIAFRVACRLDPRCAKAHAGLAMIAQQRHNFQRAFDLYMKSLELDTDNIAVLLGLFQVSCKMGSFAKVIHYLEIYLRTHLGDISVMFALAVLYLRDGRPLPSRGMLFDILAAEPGNCDAADLLEEVEHVLAERT